MNFLIEMIYVDDKKAQIVLPEEQVSDFLEKVKKNEHFSNDEGYGFSSVKEIRYINVRKVAPVEEVEEVEEDDNYNETDDHI
jgi:hypothetical protein